MFERAVPAHCGRLWVEDTPCHETLKFVTTHLWLGSANWSCNARTSAEWGLWTSDSHMVREFNQWVLRLIASSESVNSRLDEATPDLSYAECQSRTKTTVDVGWDDEEDE